MMSAEAWWQDGPWSARCVYRHWDGERPHNGTVLPSGQLT